MGQNLTQDWMEERERGFKTLYLTFNSHLLSVSGLNKRIPGLVKEEILHRKCLFFISDKKN